MQKNEWHVMDEQEELPFGALLRRFRRRKNLNQLGLAYKLGKQTRSSIDAWERGLYLPETPETVLAIADALSLSEQETDELLVAARYAPHYSRSGSATGDGDVSTRPHLEELEEYLARAVPAYEVRTYHKLFHTPSAGSSPYKFLDAFALEDASIFFGRGAAIDEVYHKVVRHRLTVLHAQSGAGKTSLLNAGISPRLIREGRLPLYVRTYEDPVLALKRLIASTVHGPWPQLLHTLSLHEFLGLVCKHRSQETQEVIVMLDQFEQFFLLWPQREDRRTFIKQLGACYDDEALPLRFVIALRKDYYSDLAEFEWVLPHLHVFQNQYHPEPMMRQEAQAAITEPLSKLGVSVSYETGLLERLLTDLMRGEIELPLLQIICTRLYETRSKDETQMTLKTYESLGRAEGVLSRYLHDVLTDLPGNEEALARNVLKELVRSDGVKQVLSYKSLVARLEAQRDELDRVLARLVNARLLRRDEMVGEIRYELVHEYLTTEIVKWVSLADQEFKQAEELLQREVTNWRIHHMLIPRNRLEVLYAHRERFKGVDTEAWKCLVHSALAEDFAVADWAKTAGKISELVLFQALKAADVEIRRRGVKTLRELRTPRAVEPLIAALQDEDSEVRQQATRALRAIRDPRAVEPLIAALQDEDSEVRQQVAGVLGAIRDPRAVEPLIATLQDKDSEVQRQATQALGAIRDPRAVEPLIAALQDKDRDVRWQAAEALRAIGDPRAVEPLIAALQDKDSEVRKQVAEVLGAIRNQRAVGPLIAALEDEDRGVRRRATRALEAIGNLAVELLITALQDKDSKVRRQAAWALAKVGDLAVEPLIAALQDEDSEVRWQVAGVLGARGDRRAVEPLITALKDEDKWVRWSAASALGKIKDPGAVKPLIAALQDEDIGVQRIAAASLRAIGTPEAAAALENARKEV